MSNLLPLSVCSSIVKFSTTDDGFALHLVDEGGDADRVFRTRVAFDVPFGAQPLVHVGLTGFDVDRADSARLRVHAEDITPHGFELVLTTWRQTKVYGAAASWLAIGQAPTSP